MFHCVHKEAVLDQKDKELDFLKFPEDQGMNKKWIHAIRRDVGKFFRITEASKVCSLHFKPTDISKGLGGRLSVNTSAVPSIFAWKKTSPLKRPPPTERSYKQVQWKSQSDEFACLSSDPEILISETPEAANEVPEMGTKFNNEVTISEIAEPSLCAINEMPSTEENVNNSPEQFRLLEEKCAALEKKMLFYTGFPNYKAFLATFEYLNPGNNGENVRYWLSGDNDVSSEHYLSPPQIGAKRGRPRSLKPEEEFFSLYVA